jgi:hypothetical protein
MAGIRVVGTPVVFTNNAGGGSDELQVPANGQATMEFEAGGAVQATWWVPFDNISDLPAIHMIETIPSGTHARLVVSGSARQRDARVRITIYAATV